MQKQCIADFTLILCLFFQRALLMRCLSFIINSIFSCSADSALIYLHIWSWLSWTSHNSDYYGMFSLSLPKWLTCEKQMYNCCRSQAIFDVLQWKTTHKVVSVDHEYTKNTMDHVLVCILNQHEGEINICPQDWTSQCCSVGFFIFFPGTRY